MSELNDRVLIWDGHGRVQPCPELDQVAEFKRLWSRDRGSDGDAQGRKKLRARREFSYIFHMHSYKSPYAATREEDRHNAIVRDIFPEDKWEPDDLVLAAARKYLELTETPILGLLRGAQEALNNMAYMFRDIVFVGANASKMKDVTAAMKDIGHLVKSLAQLEEEMLKEQRGSNTVRRGVEKTRYNS